MHRKKLMAVMLIIATAVTAMPVGAFAETVTGDIREITEADLDENNQKDVSISVEYTVGATFTVKLPSAITLSNTDGSWGYSGTVGVKGDIDAGKAVIVEPETTVKLYDVTSRPTDDLPENEDDQNYPHKDAKVLTIEQAKTVWEQTEIEVNDYKNTDLEAAVSDLSSGKWKGSLNVNIFYGADETQQAKAAGLYAADGAFTPWDDLVSAGTVIMDGNNIMYYNSSVSGEMVIPNSVTSIGIGAFNGCRSLTRITIPDSVTSIGDQAFSDCTSLTRITIPDSVTSIGEYAFQNCTSLTRITIPDGVTSIESHAFLGCSGLTRIIIPNSVTSIGNNAFNGCTGLTDITIPDSVTSIESRAFNGCTGLTSITIPDSVTSIESRAFLGCTGLIDITFTGTQEQWNAITKNSDWNYNLPATVIHCTDGDVTL